MNNVIGEVGEPNSDPRDDLRESRDSVDDDVNGSNGKVRLFFNVLLIVVGRHESITVMGSVWTRLGLWLEDLSSPDIGDVPLREDVDACLEIEEDRFLCRDEVDV